jgi:hypothetical protein
MTDATGALATGVAEARADAVARGTAVRLDILPAAAPDSGARLVSSAGRRDQILPTGVAVDWPRDGLVFYGDGTATAWDGMIRNNGAIRRFHIDPDRARADFGA